MNTLKFILGISFIYFTFIGCEKKEIDTDPNNTNEVKEEAVVGFNYEDVKGEFEGDYLGKKAVLNLKDNSNYTLTYGVKNYEGKFYYRNDGSTIELEFMEYQTSLPFYLLKIEDPSFLVIIKDEEFTEYYLEKKSK